MAAKKGTGLLMVWCDVLEEQEDEFNRWYNSEHIAERKVERDVFSDGLRPVAEDEAVC